MRIILAMAAALMLMTGPALAASDSADETWSKKPDNSALGKAKTALDDKNYEDALSHLKTALAEDPKSADAHNLTGFALRKLGRYDEAGASYDTALSIDPEHPGALEYQGELFLKLGELEKAKANLEKLDDICWLGCESYSLLRDAIAQYQATN